MLFRASPRAPQARPARDLSLRRGDCDALHRWGNHHRDHGRRVLVSRCRELRPPSHSTPRLNSSAHTTHTTPSKQEQPAPSSAAGNSLPAHIGSVRCPDRFPPQSTFALAAPMCRFPYPKTHTRTLTHAHAHTHMIATNAHAHRSHAHALPSPQPLTPLLSGTHWTSMAIAFFVIGSLAFIPGAYSSWIAYASYRGWPGYSFDQIPHVQ